MRLPDRLALAHQKAGIRGIGLPSRVFPYLRSMSVCTSLDNGTPRTMIRLVSGIPGDLGEVTIVIAHCSINWID
jgi:hypothetical protein